MTYEPKVSIVIPIYAAEKYLNQCVESVVNQTYRNLEIILVDDESPDGCPEMCDMWAEKDNRVCVVHKKNEGQGIARNVGIQKATGEYICFFDSDDAIASDTIQMAVQCAQEKRAELVVFGMADIDEKGTVLAQYPPCVKKLAFYGEEVRDLFISEFISPTLDSLGNRAFCTSSCVILYSMDVIRKHDWRYISERVIISEDVYSLLDLFQYIQSVAVLPKALYFCRRNTESFSRKYTPDRYQKIRHFYQETVKLCTDIQYSEKIIESVSTPFLSYTLGTLKQEAISSMPLKHRFMAVKSIIDDRVLQQVINKSKNKKTSWTRSLILQCIRKKLYWICFILFRAKA